MTENFEAPAARPSAPAERCETVTEVSLEAKRKALPPMAEERLNSSSSFALFRSDVVVGVRADHQRLADLLGLAADRRFRCRCGDFRIFLEIVLGVLAALADADRSRS